MKYNERAGCRTWAVILALVVAGLASCSKNTSEPEYDADVLIVGAGLAGLSAAVDAANGGADVLVIDMNSVFGGHGIQSGGVAVVGSPQQAEMGYTDSPDLAYDDWMAWTIDGDPDWTRFYVENSRELIYDWVTGLGTRFDRVIPSHGNSIPRFHMTYRRGLNLTRPIYLEAMRYPNIRFRWNLEAKRLLKTGARVAGVSAIELRSGTMVELKARSVVLATGGFESNIDLVRDNWPADVPAPNQIFSMSGQNSRGSGLQMAAEAGAALRHLDRQYNGYAALPNVLGLDDNRGFVGGTGRSIWVNNDGLRFVTEGAIDRYVFPRVMEQDPPGYWRIFDDDDKDTFRINSPHFVSADAVDQAKIRRLVIDNPAITVKANSVEELAAAIGVPAEALVQTVEDFNARVVRGDSTDVAGLSSESDPPEFTIDAPPYYAMRTYPMANKSAGGISIDMGARALDERGLPVPGLYAAGEVTGSAGINGLNGLDGMFTGPSILTGRIAGRTAAADLATAGWSPKTVVRHDLADLATGEPFAETGARLPDFDAADLAQMLAVARDGYWHFERVHHLVLEREYDCSRCHSVAVPFAAATSREQRIAQARTCDSCHLAPEGTLDPTANQGTVREP